MKILKTFLFFTFIGAFSLLLVACATERPVGNGVVLHITKISNPDSHPHSETATGAGVGAGGGAAIGALAGTTAGAAAAVGTFGLGLPLIPIFALHGAIVGAAIGGAGGAGVGYEAGKAKQGIGLYQFTVRLDQPPHTVVVTEFIQRPIPLYSRVTVILQNNQLAIKQ